MRKSFFTQHSALGTRHFYLDAFYLVILVAYILAGAALVPFHGDEATQITMSRDYAYQFLQGDIDRVRYHDPPISAQEQELRLLNGTLNKYLIGVSWHVGGFTVDQINEQWDWGADWNYNQTTNHAPSEALLQISRVPSSLLLAAGVIVMFALGRALGGRGVAYLASAYYALSPALLINGRRAMMEGSMIAFSLLVVLAAIWLLRHRSWWVGILLGIAAGLGLASKHTSVFTVIAVFGACAAYPLAQRIGSVGARYIAPLRTWILLIAAGVIALAVFYALNPVWWGDPFARAGQVLDLRADLLEGQTAAFSGYATSADALGGWFRQVFVGLPQYYEISAWQGYIGDQVARYEASIWGGVSIGGSLIGGLIVMFLTVAGFWGLLRDRSGNHATRWLVGVWVLAMLLTTALLTPLEWQRYYLPAIPAVGLMAVYGLVRLVRRYIPASAVAN